MVKSVPGKGRADKRRGKKASAAPSPDGKRRGKKASAAPIAEPPPSPDDVRRQLASGLMVCFRDAMRLVHASGDPVAMRIARILWGLIYAVNKSPESLIGKDGPNVWANRVLGRLNPYPEDGRTGTHVVAARWFLKCIGAALDQIKAGTHLLAGDRFPLDVFLQKAGVRMLNAALPYPEAANARFHARMAEFEVTHGKPAPVDVIDAIWSDVFSNQKRSVNPSVAMATFLWDRVLKEPMMATLRPPLPVDGLVRIEKALRWIRLEEKDAEHVGIAVLKALGVKDARHAFRGVDSAAR